MVETVNCSPGELFAGYANLTTIVCGECGVMFAMPEGLDRKAQADHSRPFWCPNGHRLTYVGKTTAQRLLEEVDRVNYLRQSAACLTAERDRAKASLRAQKGATTKLKKRIAGGVCPVPDCRRSFASLAEHIAKEHPGYPPDEGT